MDIFAAKALIAALENTLRKVDKIVIGCNNAGETEIKIDWKHHTKPSKDVE